jgi:hypothetical protein
MEGLIEQLDLVLASDENAEQGLINILAAAEADRF